MIRSYLWIFRVAAHDHATIVEYETYRNGPQYGHHPHPGTQGQPINLSGPPPHAHAPIPTVSSAYDMYSTAPRWSHMLSASTTGTKRKRREQAAERASERASDEDADRASTNHAHRPVVSQQILQASVDLTVSIDAKFTIKPPLTSSV